MNRDERSKLMMRTREFQREVLPAFNDYISLLEDTLESENRKLENIPDEWSTGNIYEKISDGCEVIEAAIESVQEAAQQIEDIPSELGITMRKPRTKDLTESKNGAPMCQPAPIGTDEKRTERLQLVLTPSLMEQLKQKSAMSGTSMNEIVFRLLKAEFNIQKTI